jgi:hypothetical protein
LSRKFRSLSDEFQNRIVDTFFPGRRFELLGRTEPGPWMTRERFFEPFETRNAAFSHGWVLKGRGEELGALESALNDSGARLILVTAADCGATFEGERFVNKDEWRHLRQ